MHPELGLVVAIFLATTFFIERCVFFGGLFRFVEEK